MNKNTKNFNEKKGHLEISKNEISIDNPLQTLSKVVEDETRHSTALIPLVKNQNFWWIQLVKNENMPKIFDKIDLSNTTTSTLKKYKNKDIFAIGYREISKDCNKTIAAFHISKAVKKTDIIASFHMLGINVYKICDIIALADGSQIVLTELNYTYGNVDKLKTINEKIILDNFTIEISTISILGGFQTAIGNKKITNNNIIKINFTK